MGVESRKIRFETKGNTDIINITEAIAGEVRQTDLKTGTVTVFVPGATGGITTVEYEPGLVSDLKRLFEELAPQDRDYAHNKERGDENGHSHVRASLLGASLTVPFMEGKLQLGRWQQIVFIDFDNRPRSRELILQMVGE